MEKMSALELAEAVMEYFNDRIMSVAETKTIGAFQAILLADMDREAREQEDAARDWLRGR